jgi:hypothetical protein
MPSNGPEIFSSMSGFAVIGGAAMLIAIVAGIIIVWINISQRMSQELAMDLGLCTALILTGVVSVMLFICMFCSTIHPTERFIDGATSSPGDTVAAMTPEDTLLIGITAAEQKVCELIGRTDKYIESDVGKPGQDDPSLVVAAQRKARANVPGERLVDCTVGSPEPTLLDADARLTLMENSMKWFIDPELDATYKKAMAGCEPFATGNGNPAPMVDTGALQTRLDAINAAIADQHRTRLDPMDKQQERLNRGEVSDCQKKMGANAGADAAAASKRPPAGTPLS